MALQSVSSASSQNVFSNQSRASAALPVISALISSQIRLNQQPIRLAETIRAQSSLESVQARLTSQVSQNTGRLAEFQTLQATFGGVSDLLTSLSSIVASAQSASSGALPGLQAAAQEVISQIRSNLSSSTAAGTDFNFSVVRAGGVGVSPNLQVVERINVESVSRSIPTSGITISVQAVAGGASANLTGVRGRLNVLNLTGGVAGQLDNNVSFQATGPLGSTTFNFNAGTTKTDILAAINAETQNTGLVAEETTTGSNIIRIATEFFGSSQSLTITELADPGNEITGGSSVGANANLNVTVDGVSQIIAADGRIASFDINGVQGSFKLFDFFNTTFGLNEAIGTAVASFSIKPGGLQLDQSGSSPTRLGIPSLRFDFLAQKFGGLESIDLVNQPGLATRVVDQAISDVAGGSAVSDALVTTFGERVTAETNQLASISSQIQTTESVLATLDLFQSVQAEADFQIASLLFSQTATLFPISAAKLLS